MTLGYSHTAVYVVYAHNSKCTWTDGYRESLQTLKQDQQMLYKMTAIGRMTAIGYRPATGCNIYTISPGSRDGMAKSRPATAARGRDAAKLPRLPEVFSTRQVNFEKIELEKNLLDSKKRQKPSSGFSHARLQIPALGGICKIAWFESATAIPAFGFEGHISAAVSRGPAPGRSRGWRGPAFDRSHSRADDVFFFFAFFDPTIGRRLAFACFPFFFDHFDWQKLFSNQKKKKAMQALWASPRLSGGLLVSEFFQSEKQRSLDDQRHLSDGLRWAHRKTIVTQSLNWKRGPFSLSRSWYRTLTDVQTPIVLSITHKQPDYTWTPTSTGWEILRTRCKQSSISFSKDEALRKIKEIFSLCLWPQSLFSFNLSFFHVSPSHCRTQNRLGHAPGKIEILPMYRNLHWSHRWRGWSHRWRRLASPIIFFL